MFFKYSEIDRTIFELIRLKVVELGYLPDITQYNTAFAFKQAKDTLRDSLKLTNKQLIEINSISSSRARLEKTLSKIIIDRKSSPIGSLGGFPASYYDTVTSGNTTTFTKKMLPDATRNVRYEVRILTESATMSRIMSEIIDTVLGVRRYITGVVADDKGTFDMSRSFFIEYVNDVDVSDADFMEYVFTYDVKDIFLARETDGGSGKVIASNIVPLISVAVQAVNVDKIEDPQPLPPTPPQPNIATWEYTLPTGS